MKGILLYEKYETSSSSVHNVFYKYLCLKYPWSSTIETMCVGTVTDDPFYSRLRLQ